MYLDFFGLRDFPFRITPDARYLYLGRDHARAMAYMEYSIWSRSSFVVITGEIGAGKTTLIQKLLSTINEQVTFARIHQTQLDEREFLEALMLEFGLEAFEGSKVRLLNRLNEFLIEQYALGKRVVLIVDEAQNLDGRVLEEIRLLSGLETGEEKLLNLILVGQPELNDRLNGPGMEQLVQRIRLRYHIRALTEAEVGAYIAHRLTIAGDSSGELIGPELIPLIYEFAGGIPRLVNTLCDTTLICAFADGRSVIDALAVEAALDELQWPPYRERAGHVADSDETPEEKVVEAGRLGTEIDRLERSLNGRPVPEPNG